MYELGGPTWTTTGMRAMAEMSGTGAAFKWAKSGVGTLFFGYSSRVLESYTQNIVTGRFQRHVDDYDKFWFGTKADQTAEEYDFSSLDVNFGLFIGSRDTGCPKE